MPSVPLSFVPPDDENLTKLYIYESSVKTDVGTIIETVTAIGAYPNYIHEYTTDLAVSGLDWFRIQWEDDKGAKTDISSPVQGGTKTVVGKLVDRVLERDPTMSRQVVKQEAEGAIQWFYGDAVDPYDVTLNPSYRVLNGLTYYILGRSALAMSVIGGSETQSATIGLVSMRSGTSTQTKANFAEIMEIAFELLGKSTSLVLQMTQITTIYGGPAWASKQALVGAVLEP